MEKTLITFFSHTGNSHFLADKLAVRIDADVCEIRPLNRSVLWQYFLSTLGFRSATGIARDQIKPYQRVIIVGPTWGGKIISPIRGIMRKCLHLKKNMIFVLTCETGEEDRYSKYGYETVLGKVENLLGDYLLDKEVFSTALIETEYQRAHKTLSEKTRFTEENFQGDVLAKFNTFVARLEIGDAKKSFEKTKDFVIR